MIFKENYAFDEKENAMEIYVPCGDAYFKFTLRRLTIPYKDGGIYQNQDLWRLYELYLYEKQGDKFEKILPFPIVNNGEWEFAAKINGTPDFHGGFHGYEYLTDFSFNPTDEYFEFSQVSDIILQRTRDEKIAVHKKKYKFCEQGVTIEQSVVWNKELPLNCAYLAMLPIRRKDGNFQITDTAVFNGEEYDISKQGHETILSPGCKERLKEMTVYGKESGITATLKVDYDNRFFIQNTPQYNKLYFSYFHKGNTAPGEEWKSKSQYIFNYKKSVSE